MLTSLPLSTVSFNTENFLKNVLNYLIDNKIIDFYCYVYHFKEQDENSDHMHVYMEPTKRIDTVNLRDEFIEIVPNELPFNCLPIRKSKFDEFYLYTTHNKEYLLSKGQELKKYTYKFENFVTNDLNYFNEQVKFINFKSHLPYNDIMNAISNGMSFSEFCLTRQIPLQQLRYYETAYDMLCIRKQNKFETNEFLINQFLEEQYKNAQILNKDT